MIKDKYPKDMATWVGRVGRTFRGLANLVARRFPKKEGHLKGLRLIIKAYFFNCLFLLSN